MTTVTVTVANNWIPFAIITGSFTIFFGLVLVAHYIEKLSNKDK